MRYQSHNDATPKALSLYELNNLVAEVISLDLPDEYWVEAELSEVREVRGHCYMELVEKDIVSHTPIARASAKCWANVWSRLRPKFERAAGTAIRPGMKLMLRVRPNFHEAYGFAWIVTDICAEYTMGALARQRRQILEQLREEGVIDMQKELPIPMFAQSIAVVSSSGAAGYDDFCNQLQGNGHGLKFSTTLFAATMQGEQTEKSIIAALERINGEADRYDVVVIVRGGGSTSDLSGFDTLALAENVANFPLPIITGIGHNRDESILDIVSNTSVKTPTAAATFLVDNLTRTASLLDSLSTRLADTVSRYTQSEEQHLARLSAAFQSAASLVTIRHAATLSRASQRLAHAADSRLAEATHRLSRLSADLRAYAPQLLMEHRHRLEMLDKRAESLDPTILLKRGYSITTTADGRLVKSAADVKRGDRLVTLLAEGRIESTAN